MFALVRDPAVSDKVEELNATPLVGSLDDAAAVEKLILDNESESCEELA